MVDLNAETGEAGSEAPAIEPDAYTPGKDNDNSLRGLARGLGDWRAKKAAAESPGAQNDAARKAMAEDAPAEAAPADESTAQAEDAAPPQEAPGETQESKPEAELPPIDAPRSWTKEAKERWDGLPRETQEYLAAREQDRERELRRGQNEAAEKLKGLTAKEQAAEQARHNYEQRALEAAQFSLQQMAGAFGDLLTPQGEWDTAKITDMAANDIVRFNQWQAHQLMTSNRLSEVNRISQQREQEQTSKFNEFKKRENILFAEKAPEMADPAEAAKLQDATVKLFREVGYSDEEMSKLSTVEAFNDHRAQLIIRDAVLYRRAQQRVENVKAKPLPPVQRPGAPAEKNAARDQQLRTLEQQAKAATGTKQLRLMAQLQRVRRKA